MPKIVSQPTAKDISMISPKIGEAKTANVNKQYFKNVVTMFFLFKIVNTFLTMIFIQKI